MAKSTLALMSLSLSLLVLLSIMVYAAGESTGSPAIDNAQSSSDPICGYSYEGSCKDETQCIREGGTITTREGCTSPQVCCAKTKSKNDTRIDCEAYSSRYLRIKCRLEVQRNISLEDFNITEESCRGVNDRNRCALLYAQVRSCYDEEGRQKDQCFKRIAGFIKNNLREEGNKEALRTYAVFVLYDLQEKVEDAYESGTITSDESAQLIDQIVVIKQSIMNGQTKNQLKPQFQELKRQWQTIMK